MGLSKLILGGIMVMCALGTKAQNGWEASSLEAFSKAILSIEKSMPSGESYSFQSVYNFYEDLTGDVPTMSVEAELICNKGKELYLSQFGRLMVQNEYINVVCDTALKSIVISEANEAFMSKRNMADFEILLNSNCTVQQKKEGKLTKYYLEFPKGGRYLAAEIWLLNSGFTDTYILYTAEEVFDDSEEEDKYIRPRMEIKFRNYQSGTSAQTEKMLHVSDFIVYGEKEISLQPQYSTYELIDLRIINE